MGTCKVSLCIIALNEEGFLSDLMEDVCKQTYPHECMEIVLVDGGSTDSTKRIMDDFAEQAKGFFNVKVLDNPRRIQAAGWNVAISASSGDIVIRIDAHATIANDFVEKSLLVLLDGEDVCGGFRPTIIKDPDPWKRTLHIAEESAFGSSIASYRQDSARAKYVPSVFHGAYRRELFDEVGLFDERLMRTEDNELHYRIRKKGYRIRFDPRIRSAQYARSSFSEMIRQKYGNGFWIGRTLYVEPRCFMPYHFAPLVLVLGALGLSVVGLIWSWIPLLSTVALYLTLCLLLSMKSVIGCEEANATSVALPVLFVAIHLSYGWGTLCGIVSGLRVKLS